MRSEVFLLWKKIAAEWYLFTRFSSLQQRIRGGGGQGGRVGKRGQRRKRLMRRDTSAPWCWVTQQRHPSYISWVCAFHHGGAWTHLSPSSDGRACGVCVWSCKCVCRETSCDRALPSECCVCMFNLRRVSILIHVWHLHRLPPPLFSLFPPTLIRFRARCWSHVPAEAFAEPSSS